MGQVWDVTVWPQVSPLCWFDRFYKFLIFLGFVSSQTDRSFFIYCQDSTKLFILVYVDDIIVTGSDNSIISRFLDQIQTAFPITDLGDLHYFLGIEATRVSTGYLFCQSKYIEEILQAVGLT
jgi:hypothetical protein